MKNSKVSLGLIQNLPLRDRVLATLRDAILSGELLPGQELKETELATQMGVSRAPVREALQILSTEGLVDSVPYHGTTVRTLSQEDVEELYSLRVIFEEFAVRRIIALGNVGHVDELRCVTRDMLAASDGADLTRVSELDRAFHDALIRISGHRMLEQTWHVVSQRVRQVMALRSVIRKMDDPAAIEQIASSHLPIIDAIADRNEEKAVDLIHEHIVTSGDLVAADWAKIENLREPSSEEVASP